MKRIKMADFSEIALPWSEGLLSARLWCSGERTIVGVPELGLHCYGNSQSEAVFRLFTTLLKYHHQLKTFKNRLSKRGLAHLDLLSVWIESIENKMRAPSLAKVLM